MKKRKLRVMENMDLKTKLNYFKVLCAMVTVDDDANQLKIMELYRLMAKLKCPDDIRIELINSLKDNNHNLNEICSLIFENLEEQEKNIVRFSLMKDLLIIMGADYYEGQEKIQLFNEVKKLLYITDEHLKLIKSEYENDKDYFKKSNQLPSLKNKAKELIPISLGIGLPLTLIHINDLRHIKKRHRKGNMSPSILGKYFLLGISCCKTVEWVMGKEDRKGYKLDNQLLLEATKIHERAKLYLTKDIISMQKRMVNDEVKKIEKQVELLKKVSAMMEATEPILI